MHKTWGAFVVAGMLGATLPAFGAAPPDAPPPDKSGYNLFKPTPRDQMRDMDTDRPDTTESPITVDAGHYQLEFSFAEYAIDRRNPERQTVQRVSGAPFLLKIGLLNNVDLQLGMNGFEWTRDKDRSSGAAEEQRGVGDSLVRLKINLWGNEGADAWTTAFAVMPFASLPTATGGVGTEHVQGGLIFPLTIRLPEDFSLTVMAEVDANHSESQGGREVLDLLHSASLSHNLFGPVDGYLEYAAFANFNRDHKYAGYLDFGLLLAVSKDVQLDGGMRVGLTQAADDVGIFAGLSLRY